MEVFNVTFAYREDKEWIYSIVNVLAKDEESIESILKDQFGEVQIGSIQKWDIHKNGIILY